MLARTAGGQVPLTVELVTAGDQTVDAQASKEATTSPNFDGGTRRSRDDRGEDRTPKCRYPDSVPVIMNPR